MATTAVSDRPVRQAPVRVRELSEADREFLASAERDLTRRRAGGPGAWWVRGRDFARRSSRRLISALLILMTIGVFSVSTEQAASAYLGEGIVNNIKEFIVDFCGRTDLPTAQPGGGLDAMLLESTGDSANYTKVGGGGKNADGTLKDPEETPANEWNLWGRYANAGTDWDVFWINCIDPFRYYNMAARNIFGFTKIIASVSINMFTWTFKGDILNIFLEPNKVDGMSRMDAMLKTVHIDIFFSYMAAAIVIGATVLMWRFLFKQAGAADILSKVLIMILVAGFAFWFAGSPGDGPASKPHASQFIGALNDWTNNITASIIVAFVGSDCGVKREVSSPTEAQERAAATQEKIFNDKSVAIDCAADAMHKTMVRTPWTVGLLGSANKEDMKVAERILKQRAYTWAEKRLVDQYKSRNFDESPSVKYASQNDGFDYCKQANASTLYTKDAKRCDLHRMLLEWKIGKYNKKGDDYKAENGQDGKHKGLKSFDDRRGPFEQVGPASDASPDAARYWKHYSGSEADAQILVALLSLVAALALALMVILMSVSYLILQISTVMFTLFAPLAFLIGLIPGFGLKGLLKWLEMLLGAFIKRFGAGAFVGMYMGGQTVILSADDMPWPMKILMVVIMAVFGFAYRKKFAALFEVSFSGDKAAQQGASKLAKGLIGGFGAMQVANKQGASRLGAFRRGAMTGASTDGMLNAGHYARLHQTNVGESKADKARRKAAKGKGGAGAGAGPGAGAGAGAGGGHGDGHGPPDAQGGVAGGGDAQIDDTSPTKYRSRAQKWGGRGLFVAGLAAGGPVGAAGVWAAGKVVPRAWGVGKSGAQAVSRRTVRAYDGLGDMRDRALKAQGLDPDQAGVFRQAGAVGRQGIEYAKQRGSAAKERVELASNDVHYWAVGNRRERNELRATGRASGMSRVEARQQAAYEAAEELRRRREARRQRGDERAVRDGS